MKSIGQIKYNKPKHEPQTATDRKSIRIMTGHEGISTVIGPK